MEYFAGLDVSMKETHICVVDRDGGIVAAIAVAAGMRVDELAEVPLAFPTYAGTLVAAAASAARQLGLTVTWQAHQLEST